MEVKYLLNITRIARSSRLYLPFTAHKWKINSPFAVNVHFANIQNCLLKFCAGSGERYWRKTPLNAILNFLC